MRDPEGNLLPDTVLQERYKVINLIQTGPTSRMYRCFDIKRNRHVFVKELIATYTDPSLRQQAIEQFKKEAKILFKLKQENLPKFEDYFDYEENRYLILEYVEGKRLNVIVESQTSFLSERQVIDWSIELCEALAYLHNREPNPVIFRDLSPQSILLADEGKLKLIDFGISKIYEADAKTMGIAKTMTQHYSPIEQHAGTTDKRSDIYSLGATMYFLITREPPMDCIERIVEDEPMEPCSKFNPGISRELERIIMKAMEIDKKDRYQDIEEMKAELVKLASSTPAITDKVQTQKTAMDIHTPKPFSQIREGYDKSFERKEVIDTRTVDKSILSLKSPIKRDSLLSPSKPAFQSSEDKSPLMSRPVAGSTFPYQQKPVTTPPKPEEKHRLFGSQKVVDGKPLEGTVKSFSRPVGTDFHGGSSLIPSRRRFLEDRERPIPSRMPSKEGLPEPLQDQHPLPPRPPFKGDIGQPVEKYPQRDIRPQEGSDIYSQRPSRLSDFQPVERFSQRDIHQDEDLHRPSKSPFKGTFTQETEKSQRREIEENKEENFIPLKTQFKGTVTQEMGRTKRREFSEEDEDLTVSFRAKPSDTPKSQDFKDIMEERMPKKEAVDEHKTLIMKGIQEFMPPPRKGKFSGKEEPEIKEKPLTIIQRIFNIFKLKRGL